MSRFVSNKTRVSFSSLTFLALSRIYHLVVRAMFLYCLVTLIGKEQYGFYGYAQSWYLLLAPLAVLGGNELLINGFSRTSSGERENYVGTALSVRLALALPLSAVLILIALATESDFELRILLLIFAQALWLRVLISFYSSMFVARGLSHQWVFFSMFFTTLEAVSILWVALQESSLWALASTQIAVLFLTLVFAVVVHTRSYHHIPLSWRWPVALSFIRDGAYVGSATFLLLSIPSALIISYKTAGSDLEELGMLALISQLMLIAQQLIQRVSNALLPALNPPSEKDAGNLLAFTFLSIALCICIGGLLAMWAAPFASSVDTLLPNKVFSDALFLLADHAWIIVPMLMVQLLRLVLIANNDAKALFWSAVAGVLFFLLCVACLATENQFNPSKSLVSVGLSFSLICVIQFSRVVALVSSRH